MCEKFDNWYTHEKLELCLVLLVYQYPQVQINTFFERKFVNSFLLIHFNICFGYSKKTSQ